MPKRVLIVEDDENMARFIADILKQSELETFSVVDGVLAIKEVRQLKPDLIILDLMLPGGGGLSVLSRLKLSQHTDKIPVMVVTGTLDESCKQKALALGVASYFQKPFPVEQFSLEARRILGVSPS